MLELCDDAVVQSILDESALVLRPAHAEVADPQLHQLERQRQRRWREVHDVPYLKGFHKVERDVNRQAMEADRLEPISANISRGTAALGVLVGVVGERLLAANCHAPLAAV